MKDIRRVQLSEIAELITKGTTPTTLGYEFQNEGINFLKIECFGEKGEYIENKVAHISEECHEKLKRSQLKSGDILFSIAGAIGRVAIVTEEMLPANTNQALAIIRVADNDVYLPYIKLILTSPIVIGQFEKKKQGVAQLNLSLKDISELSIPLPSKEKQIELVKLFDKVESVISKRNKELKSLDALIKARFVEMFGDPKYNKSNLVKIGEIGTLTSGGTPSRANPEYFEGDIRWYSAGELNSLYLPDSVEHISETALQQSSAKLFNKGALMIGMYDTAAFKMGILTEDSSSNQACANLNPKQGYNIVWLYYLFDIMKPIFLQKRQGVRQKNLSLSKIKEFEVPLVPFELQNKFAAFAEQVDKLKVAVQKALEETQMLFDSLMQDYFGCSNGVRK